MAISQIVTNSIAVGAVATVDIADLAVTPAKMSQKLTSGTAVASTSGTSIDFTDIPSWVKRITVMISGVSTNGSSSLVCRVGSGSVATTGYAGGFSRAASANLDTTGLVFQIAATGTSSYYGLLTWCLVSGNTWVGSGNTITNAADAATLSNCNITLDRKSVV